MLGLSAYLLFVLCYITEGKQLLQRAKGVVEKEHYNYYNLNIEGSLALVLKSRVGDADLYVSEGSHKPTFIEYDLHAASCGTDILRIPRSFSRPFTVGVYGHYSHENSSYILEIYSGQSEEDAGPEINEHTLNEAEVEDNKFKPRLKRVLAKTGLWALLEVFEMIFL